MCNMNGVSRGYPRILTYGDIFINNLGTFLGAFKINIGVCTSFQPELHGIILVIEYANKNN